MNLILTNTCNNNCRDCFAKGFKKHARQEMSVDFIKNIPPRNEGDNPDVRLLGGEPLLHPEIFGILNILHEKNYVPLLLTNLNFPKETISKISDYLSKENCLKILINLTYEDVEYIPARVLENIKYLSGVISTTNTQKNQHIGVDYTLGIFKNNLNYIKSLYEKLDHNYSLCIGLPLPADDEKNFTYKDFINNKKIGDEIIQILRFCSLNNIVCTIDCCIYPCMFSDLLEFECLCDRFTYICDFNSEYDIFPDLTASFCFPLRNETKVPLDENTSQNLREKLEKIKKGFYVKECSGCEYFYSRICQGPCPALYK